jgi:hypothetical protein
MVSPQSAGSGANQVVPRGNSEILRARLPAAALIIGKEGNG